MDSRSIMKKTATQFMPAEKTNFAGSPQPASSKDSTQDSTIVELALNTGSERTEAQDISIKDAVSRAMEQYFNHLGDQNATKLYDMVLHQVEPALLSSVLNHTGGNQSKAAQALGLNRGTLRKKLLQYGLS